MIAASNPKLATLPVYADVEVSDSVLEREDKSIATHERVYYEPDEDFYRSITMDEFKARALEMLERVSKMYIGK